MIVALALAACVGNPAQPSAKATETPTQPASPNPSPTLSQSPTPAASPSPTGSAAAGQADASAAYTGFHAYIDRINNSYFAFMLDSIASPAGSVAFGVQGLGMIGIGAPTFSIPDPHAMTIQYEGQATLETDAKIELDLGLNMPGSTDRTVSVRFSGVVDLVAGTAKADLWLDGKHYVLVGGRPDKSPDRALAALVAAIGRQDWGGVYDMTAPLFSRLITRDAYASQMTSYWQDHYGTAATRVRLTDTPTLADSGFGYWVVSVRLEISAGSVTDELNVTMQYVGESWLVLDVRPV